MTPAMSSACAQRDAAMARVTRNADAKAQGWSESAYGHLCSFARGTELFTSDEVIKAADPAGVERPHDPRAWGSLFSKAAREGVIVQDGWARHPSRHAAICVRWRSQVFVGGSA